MNEKRFILIIFSAIAVTVIISTFVCINVFSNNKYSLEDNENYSEENALMVKQLYDTSDMEEEFVKTYEEISSVLSSKLLDGSITDEQSLLGEIKYINAVLLSNDWNSLNVVKPVKWLGTWYLDSNGFLKFRFSNKSIEPSWINNKSVSEYIVLNK